MSREAKKAALETTFGAVLEQLKESKELIRKAALLQRAQHSPENLTEHIAITRQPDYYFEDWNGREYLADLKNIWYYPLKPVLKLSDIRFYQQTPAWVQEYVLSKRWDAPNYVPCEFVWAYDPERRGGIRMHNMVRVRNPLTIQKLYVSTIPSFTPGAMKLLLTSGFETLFTNHPIVPEPTRTGELAQGIKCGLKADFTLYEKVRDLVEREGGS